MIENQYAHLADYYDRLFPVTETVRTFLLSQFKQAKTVLDVGCGTGRHALQMAEGGKVVIGVDPDASMLAIAKKRPLVKRGSCRFVRGHLTDLGVSESFEGIMVLGNTLCHVADETELEQALVGLYERLETGGMLVLQLINYDLIFNQNITELPRLEEGGVSLRRQYVLNRPFVRFTTTLFDGTTDHTETVQLLGITKAMLEGALKKARFTNVQAYGDFSKKPFDVKTDLRVILTAQKFKKAGHSNAR